MHFKNQNNCTPGPQAGGPCGPVRVRGPAAGTPERGPQWPDAFASPSAPRRMKPQGRGETPGQPGPGRACRLSQPGPRGGRRASALQAGTRQPDSRPRHVGKDARPPRRAPGSRTGRGAPCRRTGGRALPERGVPTEVGQVCGARRAGGGRCRGRSRPTSWRQPDAAVPSPPRPGRARCPLPAPWDFRGPAALRGAPPRAASGAGESAARWQGSRRGGGRGGVRRASTLPSRWPSLLPVLQPIRRPLGREAWGAP